MANKLSWREKKIWLARGKPIIDGLFTGTCPFYQIQFAFNENRLLISQNYQQELRIHVCDYPCPFSVVSGVSSFGSRLECGRPEIHIFLPELERLILSIKAIKVAKPEHTESMISSLIMIGFMHETDHFALSMAGNTPIEEMIEWEIAVNARTCQNTIVPLYENCQQCLASGEAFHYKEWVNGGRDVNSLLWRKHITNMYSTFRLV